MSRFPTPAHLVSWARFAPKARQSAGKTRPSTTGKGNPWLGGTLGESVAAAARTSTFLASRYKRIVKRRGKQRALVAVGNSLLTIAWHLLSDPGALRRPRPHLARPPHPPAAQTPAHRRTRTPFRHESHPGGGRL